MDHEYTELRPLDDSCRDLLFAAMDSTRALSDRAEFSGQHHLIQTLLKIEQLFASCLDHWDHGRPVKAGEPGSIGDVGLTDRTTSGPADNPSEMQQTSLRCNPSGAVK